MQADTACVLGAGLLAGLAAGAAVIVPRWLRLRRAVRVRLSPVVQRRLERDGNLEGGGQQRTVTVVFTDIRDFTPFADQRPPEQVGAFLNACFSVIVPVVEAHGGQVITFLGDGLLALFDSDGDCRDHAVRAVRAAVALQERVDQAGPLWEQLGFPALHLGVGIHTGPGLVGFFGSAERLSYNVLGDTVILASRIEALTKEMGCALLISSDTWRELPPEQQRLLGCSPESITIQIKGRRAPMDVHLVSGSAR
jgi:adenylate cyclase